VSDPAAPPDRWAALRRLTPARLALGVAGAGTPTAAHLAFQADHASARDAVHDALDVAAIARDLAALGLGPPLVATSLAGDRVTYLRRPDLGRQLAAADAARLAAAGPGGPDLLFVVADGLSARAVQRHAAPLLRETLARLDRGAWRVAAPVVVTQGRVAVGDRCAESLRAEFVAVLIGERPGLTASDSLGVYLTRRPGDGTTDADRNCLSNIRPAGLGYAEAAARLCALLEAARALGATGIRLKDAQPPLTASS
jgi:ethanolamine ammonia-lyase small subunit